MVGVAGKSKACHDCKRRRVKCGFERPGCIRCDKAGLACSGYASNMVFVNSTQESPSVSAQCAISAHKKRRFSETESDPQLLAEELRYFEDYITKHNDDPRMYRQRIFSVLVQLYLPQLKPELQVRSGACTWVEVVCSLKCHNPCLDYALFAFAITQLYVTQAVTISHDRALQVYHEAVQKLAATIAKGSTEDFHHMLSAITALSTCEIFIQPTDDGWRAHTTGVAEILRLSTTISRAGMSSQSTYIYSRLRVMTVVSDLTRRKKGTLPVSDWKTILPGSLISDPLDQIIDMASDLPELFEQADSLTVIEQSTSNPILCLLSHFEVILGRLHDYYTACITNVKDPQYTLVPSLLHNPADDAHDARLFPLVLRFVTLHVASYYILAWAIHLQVLATVLYLREQLPSDFEVDPSMTMFPVQSGALVRRNPDALLQEANEYANNLCRCIEYCHQTSMRTLGPQCTLYAQWSLKRWFRQTGRQRELKWLLNVKNMTGANTRCGINMMVFQAD